jgi:hypothetical protein
MSDHMFLVLTFKTSTMKTKSILLTTFFLALSFTQLIAQEASNESTTTNVKSEKSELIASKKEAKKEKSEMRKLSGITIPQLTRDAFYSDFGNVPDAKWNRAVYFDEAVFTKDGKEMKAYYDFNNKLVGTTMMKSFNDVPIKAQNEIKTKYKDYAIKQVVYFDDNELNESDMLLWETPFDDEDNYFVVLSKESNNIILKVNLRGDVVFFTKM